MNKKVLIKLENRQDYVGEQAATNIKSEFKGELYIKKEKYYLSYNDHSEGLDGARTILKIDPKTERVLLLREEPAEMKQTFKKAQKIKGYFKTAYGKLELAVKTSHLKIDIEDSNGIIKIEYQLFLGGELSSQHKLKLSYTIL
ncbi:DUF1934 domain-containing protein [Halanaerobium hydrogeniformans]|uniref:DUF1934 domain-containing protein n=1 Tax=Halanaerobium hydrogeniformans TaxID=656519 RepID=E4RP29_HALHG|nr:DUF1934 domain-containing protein [Halanaerobium hydrogeniformans]ADQ13854.1 Domain of unknown function DUF1934 [Halanaerobium hydrogeniformans]